MDAFPYEPRPGQRELVAHLARAVEDGGHAVAESGTGTGKTVSALAAALPRALGAGKRVLYLTRTNAQTRQVMVEFRAIAPRLAAPASAVALQGRTHLCTLAREDAELAKADAEELALMCRDRVRASEESAAGRKPRHRPCEHFERTRGEAFEALALRMRAESPAAEDLAAAAAAVGMCPYYVSRELLKDATLVAAPYVYYLHPRMRRALLEWMGVAPGDLVVVIDEAHNLPEHARGLLSTDLGRGTLERAAREVEEFGEREVVPGLGLSTFLLRLGGVVEDLAREFLDGEDGLVPPEAFDVEVLSALRSTTRTWDRVAGLLLGYGEEVRESRRRAGRVPRSYVGAVGAFLVAYREAEPETYLRLVEDAPSGPRLALACLDASLASAALLECHATLHLSGTLAPLGAYRDEVGLPEEAALRTFPSPFAAERRLLLVDPDVTTRHADVLREPAMWDRIGGRLAALREATVGRNMAVFAPSFDTLARLRPHLDPDIVERRDARQSDLMDALAAFKRARGATLLAVAAGRLAEGLDFPGGELEVVVVAGLPYPKPTARVRGLVRFHDARHGRGFEVAVAAPALRRTLQAVGRLIRSPEDRGVAVVLDRRAVALLDGTPGVEVDADVAARAAAFFAAPHAVSAKGS